MKAPIVLIGTGEMGGVFARGLLKLGHPVYPINRDTELSAAAEQLPSPEAVLVAVGEKDIADTLADIPSQWRNNLILLQNELLPRDWQAQQLDNPTVISVWFEKKPGQDAKVLLPSPVFGPHAQLMHDALQSLGIPVNMLDSADALLFELVVKNVYIVTTNIAGLKVGGTVSELWQQHEALTHNVATEVIRIQKSLTGRQFSNEDLLHGMLKAFDGDPDHRCMGRSAPARLERALTQAADAGISVPHMQAIKAASSTT